MMRLREREGGESRGENEIMTRGIVSFKCNILVA